MLTQYPSSKYKYYLTSFVIVNVRSLLCRNPRGNRLPHTFLKVLKWYCDQKNNSIFSLDFKSTLSKYQLTHVLSSDFKKTPVYFHWNFLIYWSAITNFKILRELGRGENDVKDALV